MGKKQYMENRDYKCIHKETGECREFPLSTVNDPILMDRIGYELHPIEKIKLKGDLISTPNENKPQVDPLLKPKLQVDPPAENKPQVDPPAENKPVDSSEKDPILSQKIGDLHKLSVADFTNLIGQIKTPEQAEHMESAAKHRSEAIRQMVADKKSNVYSL